MKIGQVVAQRILQLCVERDLTLNMLGTICGITQSTLNNIVNGGSRNPTVSTIKKICDGLEMTLSQFFDTPEFNGLDQEMK